MSAFRRTVGSPAKAGHYVLYGIEIRSKDEIDVLTTKAELSADIARLATKEKLAAAIAEHLGR